MTLQMQIDGVIIPIPTHPYTPRFVIGRGRYRRNGGMPTDSKLNVALELETTCNLEKTLMYVSPAWRCPHHPLRLKETSHS